MPIISSTTRKDKGTIPQLIHYVSEQKAELTSSIIILHNIKAQSHDIPAIIQAFKDNDNHRKKRKGGIILYHDIIAFHPDDRQAIKNKPFILEDMARNYISKRAPDALAYAKVHLDKDHLHIHVVLSANEKGSTKSIRISKTAFTQIRKDIERYQQAHYPELTHSYIRPELKKTKEQERSR